MRGTGARGWRPHPLAVGYVVLMVVLYGVGELADGRVDDPLAADALTVPFLVLLLPCVVPVALVLAIGITTLGALVPSSASELVWPVGLVFTVLANATLLHVLARARAGARARRTGAVARC